MQIGMKNKTLLTILLMLFLPGGLFADGPKPAVKIDDCIIDSIDFTGVNRALISETLRKEAQKFVGQKYNQQSVNDLVNRLREELNREYDISVQNTVQPGEEPVRVQVVFHATRRNNNPKFTIPDFNINERYTVESVQFEGIDESKISDDLRQEAQKFVGQKYDAQAANEFGKKLHEELKDKYLVTRVEVKGDKGEKELHIKLRFKFHKEGPVDLQLPIFMYHSKQGYSGALDLVFRNNRTEFLFGIISDADTLLERNAGLYLSLKHRGLGTDVLGFKIDFGSFHQGFDNATRAALEQNPELPDFYRARQDFAPSLSVHPFKNLTLNVGLSYQRLEHQYPTLHTETAYAGTGDIQYSRELSFLSGYRQNVTASYGLRTATRVLDSDYVYTRHHWRADYELSKGKSRLEARFTGGIIGGRAPLFERFSLGNSLTLRGWNKFDVAPAGGSRMAHGSLEYRYRSLAVFYDVGAVWDSGQYNPVRHGLGFGLQSKKNFFLSLAFPVRLKNVAPIFMVGHRF